MSFPFLLPKHAKNWERTFWHTLSYDYHMTLLGECVLHTEQCRRQACEDTRTNRTCQVSMISSHLHRLQSYLLRLSPLVKPMNENTALRRGSGHEVPPFTKKLFAVALTTGKGKHLLSPVEWHWVYRPHQGRFDAPESSPNATFCVRQGEPFLFHFDIFVLLGFFCLFVCFACVFYCCCCCCCWEREWSWVDREVERVWRELCQPWQLGLGV